MRTMLYRDQNNTEKVIIGTMYRPPSTNISEFINIFDTQIGKINNKGYECIIGLNHNLDLLKQSVHSKPKNSWNASKTITYCQQ